MFPRGAIVFFSVALGEGGDVGDVAFNGAFDGLRMVWAWAVVFDTIFAEGAVGEAIVGDGIIGDGTGDGAVGYFSNSDEI